LLKDKGMVFSGPYYELLRVLIRAGLLRLPIVMFCNTCHVRDSRIVKDIMLAMSSLSGKPFEVPPTGKIAVKVINHYGDEVLKVYEVKENKS
jgi:hypothetical protein